MPVYEKDLKSESSLKISLANSSVIIFALLALSAYRIFECKTSDGLTDTVSVSASFLDSSTDT